jgi:hypothetical protein
VVLSTSPITDLLLAAGKAQLKADGNAANEDDIRITGNQMESNKDEDLLEPNED